MLVLTRKQQEKIRIGDSITITVLRTKGKAVRLGIEAPADVPVIRGELVFDASPEALTRRVRGNTSQDAVGVPTVERQAGVQALRAKTNWTTESHPHVPDRGKNVEVSLRRVPRDEIAQVLPTLVAGPAPLRAMLDARTSTM
jgi:carbon storage regulator